MKSNILTRTSAWIFLLLLAACSGEEREPTLVDVLARERARITDFLAQQGGVTITAIPYESKKGQLIDCTYIFNNTLPSPASAPEKGDFVLLDYSIQRLDSTYIESTDPTVQADTFRYAVRGPIYHRTDTSKHYDYVGDALAYIAEGTRGDLLVPSILHDKSGNTLHYTLEPRRVIRDLFAYEKALINTFVTTSLPSPVNAYQDGNADTLVHTLVRATEAGTRTIQPGDTVTFYRLCLVLVEANPPLRVAFPLDTLSTNNFDPARLEFPACGDAFAHLREGDEADIVIPNSLAFGARPGYHPADTRKTIPWIPPYSTIVYTVKIARVGEKL
jgi:hypothetical protein